MQNGLDDSGPNGPSTSKRVTKRRNSDTVNNPSKKLKIRPTNFANQNIEFLIPGANLLKFPNNPNSYPFKYKEDFHYEELIFAHQQSVVKKYLHRLSGRELAIKFIRYYQHYRLHRKQNSDKLKELQKEIEIHQKVATCSSIVSFYGFCIFEDHILICMELMDMSLRDFYSWLHEEKIAISEEVLWHIIVSVIKALKVCKENSVMHRDIKPLNILVNSRGEIKLCDFGVSRILDDSKASTFIGTVAYMPPERFTDGRVRYDFRSEIWSLGITILEFIVGKLPYVQNEENMDIIILQNLIKEYKFTEDKILEAYSEDLKSFIESYLKPVSERPKLEMFFDMETYKRHENYLLSEEYFEHVKRAIESLNSPKNKTTNLMNHQGRITYDKLVFDHPETEYKFLLGDFQFKEQIGISKNIVNKYEHKHARKIVAIKSVNIPFSRYPSLPRTPITNNIMQTKKLEQEVSTLLTVGKHKNIIKCYGMSIQDSKLLICMEYMDLALMHLYLFAHECDGYFPENLLGAITMAILNALNFCKSLNYIHRDIKPDNILINWSGEIKLADFGEARLLDDSLASTFVGTLRYLSPERFEVGLNKYDIRVDVWSLGITLLECMYGHFPIKDKEGIEISHISISSYIKQIDPLSLINDSPPTL